MFRAFGALFLFGLLFVIPNAFSQSDLTETEPDSIKFPSCEDGKVLAKQDFKNGIRKIYSFGLVIQIKSDGFPEFYGRYMKRKYAVEFISRGCVVHHDLKCYSDVMKNLLEKKYGQDFFEKSRRDAEVLFRKSQKKKK